MNFPTLPESALEITFVDLLAFKRISPILFNKLTAYATLTTVNDLYRNYYSVEDFVTRVRTAGKRVGIELSELLAELSGGNTTETDSHKVLLIDSPPIADPIPKFDDDVAAITFDALKRKKLISNLLYNKLVRDAKLTCVGELNDRFRSVEEFVKSIRGAGVAAKIEMRQMLDGLSTSPGHYLRAHQSIQGIYLPYQFDLTQSLAHNLTLLLTDTIQELKNRDRKAHGPVAEHIYLKGRTLEDTGILLHLTKERIRQIRNELGEAFKAWFMDNVNDTLPNFFIHPELRDQINKLITDLTAKFSLLADKEELMAWLADQDVVFDVANRAAWSFFCRVAEIRQTGKIESNFTKADFYITNPTFDKGLFFTIGKATLDTLKNSVLPIQRDEVVIAVNQLIKQEAANQQKPLRKVLAQMVDLSLTKLPEIERLDQDGLVTYQIRFHYLSSQADMAERVLFEAGHAMYFDDIVTDIQKRLRQVDIERDFEDSGLRGQMLNEKKHIIHHGRNSLYSWYDPKANQPTIAYSKTDLVKKALLEANKPLLPTHIDAYINAYLNQVGVAANHELKTTSAILSYLLNQRNGVSRLLDGSYILKSWESQYQQTLEKEPIRKVKGSLLKKVLLMLDEAPDKTLRRDTLSIKLRSEGHPGPSIYSVLNRIDVIEQFHQDGKTYIRRLPDSVATPKVHKQEQIRDRIVTLLSSVQGNRLSLKVIVVQLVNEFSLTKTQRPIVYKIVTANPTLFFKEEKDETLITLISSPSQPTIVEAFDPSKHWQTLKKTLLTETESILMVINKRKPSDVLDLFSEVAQRNSTHEDLEGLCHLLDYLWNYYSVKVSDQQKYLYARAIITLMEPYLLKILSHANSYYYDEYQADEKKGLALLTKKLYKANPWKMPQTKAIYELAKSARNKAAHSARLWDVVKERERVNACLIEMLYVVDCYYSDLSLLNK